MGTRSPGLGTSVLMIVSDMLLLNSLIVKNHGEKGFRDRGPVLCF